MFLDPSSTWLQLLAPTVEVITSSLIFNRQIKHPWCHRLHSASETHFEEAQASEGTYLQRGAREVSGEQAWDVRLTKLRWEESQADSSQAPDQPAWQVRVLYQRHAHDPWRLSLEDYRRVCAQPQQLLYLPRQAGRCPLHTRSFNGGLLHAATISSREQTCADVWRTVREHRLQISVWRLQIQACQLWWDHQEGVRGTLEPPPWKSQTEGTVGVRWVDERVPSWPERHREGSSSCRDTPHW